MGFPKGRSAALPFGRSTGLPRGGEIYIDPVPRRFLELRNRCVQHGGGRMAERRARVAHVSLRMLDWRRDRSLITARLFKPAAVKK